MRKLQLFFFFSVCFIFNQNWAQNTLEYRKTIAIYEQKLSKLKLDDPEYLPVHRLFIKDMLEEISSIQSDDKLCEGLSSSECLDKEIAYSNIYAKVKRYQEKADTNFRHIETLFVNQAQDAYYLNQKDKAFYFLDKALEYKPNSCFLLIKKAEFLIDDQRFYDCAETIYQLYNKKDIDRHFEMMTSDLTMNLYRKLVDYGDSLLRVQNAAEAVKIFDLLETFCQNIPSGYCNEDYYIGLIRSKKGIFDSYIDIALVAIERGKYELANTFITYAENYREDNQEYIEYNEDITKKIQQCYEKIYASILKESLKYLHWKDYINTRIFLDSAVLYYAKYQLNTYNQDSMTIVQTLAEHELEFLWVQTQKELQSDNISGAYALTQQTRHIKETVGYRNHFLDAESMAMIRRLVERYMFNTEQAVLNSNYVQMSNLRDTVNMLFYTYNLDNDTLFTDRLIQMNEKVVQYLSFYLNSEIKDTRVLVSKLLDNQNFNQCIEKIEKLKNQLKLEATLIHDISDLDTIYEQFVDLGKFEKYRDNAEWAFRNQNFSEGFQYYKQAEILYFTILVNNGKADTYHVQFDSLGSYVYDFNNQVLFDSVGAFLASEGRYEEAIKLMKENVLKHKYSDKNYQQYLGKNYRKELLTHHLNAQSLKLKVDEQDLNHKNFVNYQKAFLNKKLLFYVKNTRIAIF